MPKTESPGTANLRADPSVYHATPNSSPGGSGKDMGGTANLGATTKVLTNPGKMVGVYSKDQRPSGVQHFPMAEPEVGR